MREIQKIKCLFDEISNVEYYSFCINIRYSLFNPNSEQKKGVSDRPVSELAASNDSSATPTICANPRKRL